MKLGMSLSLALSLVTQLSLVARAEDHREDRREEHHEVRHEERHDERLPPRAAAPDWRAHPPGAHPPGAGYHPGYHPHAVRVLRPRAFRYGEHPYRHWGHPEFVRPAYYWDWRLVHSVSCTAEDSYGDQYPVTESTFAGFGLGNMTAVEDDALDRCYDESGGDPSCYLATCSHF
ncbi:MAG TPA: hypothetical protein VK989_20470 [Polyangia bacterium]|jgi:hypothetical protein|nr:hypothetical protein [Polyangia bacterium]